MLVPSLSRKIIILFIFIYMESVQSASNNEIKDNVVKEYLAARQVYVYRAYKDMQIFHFNIPPYTSSSVFNLTSNNTDGCTSRNITVYLQAKSYPVVNPDGSAFPDLAWVSRQPIYQATLLSDLTPAFLTVVGPQPGDWFMVAFVFDDSNRITQAGLFPSCYAWLQIEASYYQENNVEIIEAQIVGNETTVNFLPFEIDKSTFFSFFVLSEVWSAELAIKNCRSLNESRDVEVLDGSGICPLNVLLRPLALPFPSTPDNVEKNCSNEESSNCSLPFTPMPGAWHYCSVIPSNEGSVSFDVGISLYACGSEEESGFVESPYPFIFEREFVVKEINLEEKLKDSVDMLNLSINATYPALKLSNIKHIGEKTYEMRHKHGGFLSPDSRGGGTIEPLTNDVEIPNDNGNPLIVFRNMRKRSVDENLNIDIENKTDAFDSVRLDVNLRVPTRNNFKESTCWPSHQLTRKTFPGNFVYEYDFRPDVNGSVPLMLNLSNQVPTILTFDVHSIIDIGGTLSVDLALSPFVNTTVHNSTVLGCLSVDMRPSFEEIDGEVTCGRGYTVRINTSDPAHFATSVMIPYPEPGKWFFTLLPSCFLQNQSSFVSCSTNVTSVIFSVASSSCIMGKCGEYGACFQYISGGFIFSTCVCDVGYRGYACNDGSASIPNWKLLLSTLLLCLSNLLFLPAICLALYRRFYTEALVYAFTMFFSTFYHACDQDIYNFCLMRLSVLQFCDFYSAILSFWVTLIVMANLPPSVHSILHMAGAVIVALGVEYDRTGLGVFAIPSISALIIMAFAWIVHTKKEKKCYPPRKYWVRCLIPGTVLAATGLICYAFLETEDNYYIIHSFWHSIMALSILCLLPPAAKSKADSSVEDVEFQTSDAQALTVNLNL